MLRFVPQIRSSFAVFACALAPMWLGACSRTGLLVDSSGGAGVDGDGDNGSDGRDRCGRDRLEVLRVDVEDGTFVQPLALDAQGGRLLLAGQHRFPSPGSGHLAYFLRVDAEGPLRPDEAFGSGGILELGFGGLVSASSGVVLRAGGSALAAIELWPPNESEIPGRLLKLDPGGATDPNFGAEGSVELDGAPHGLEQTPSGDLVLKETGLAPGATTRPAALLRFGPEGALRSDFGEAGRFEFEQHALATAPFDVDPSGRIVLLIRTEGGATILRLLEDGTPDPAFGSGGASSLVPPVGFSAPLGFGGADVEVDAEGRVFVALSVFPEGGFVDEELTLVSRLTEFGAADPLYGSQGAALVPGVSLSSATADAEGRVVLGGHARAAPEAAFEGQAVAARLDPDGALDPSFGEAGVVFLPPERSLSSAFLVGVRGGGEVFLGGRDGGPLVVRIPAGCGGR